MAQPSIRAIGLAGGLRGVGTSPSISSQHPSAPDTLSKVWIVERMAAKIVRPTVLFIVLALHLATLALLRARSRTLNMASAAEHPVELVFLAPVKPPQVRLENSLPQHWSTNIAVALAPPALNSSSHTGHGSAPDGQGPAVNWAAEAHRAVRAFEIGGHQTRSRAPPGSSSAAVSG